MRVLIWRDESIEFINEHLHDDDEDGSHDFDDNNNEGQPNLKNLFKVPMVFNTPFGQVSSNDPDNILFEKQMFSGHANFHIDATILEKLLKIPGVDGLRILSPYSFAVCIGMCFSYREVLMDIENALQIDSNGNLDEDSELIPEEQSPEEILEENKELIKIATSDLNNEKFWYVYIFPNGEVLTEKFKDGEAMDERTDYFMELSCLSAGILLSSIDNL